MTGLKNKNFYSLKQTNEVKRQRQPWGWGGKIFTIKGLVFRTYKEVLKLTNQEDKQLIKIEPKL